MASPPLAGLRIVEMAGIGPGPFCGMMLADHGAEVIRIDRGVQPGFSDPAKDPLLRSRRSVSLDLKTPQAIANQVGGKVQILAPSVGGTKEASDYIQLFDYDVNLLASTLKQFSAK